MPPKVKAAKKHLQDRSESVSASQTSTSDSLNSLPSSPSGKVNQFASLPKNNTSMIAYVRQLSLQTKKNTMDYSNLALQADDSTKEALCYSKNKWPLLNESQTSRTPIKLQRFTFTEDQAKLVINDMTNTSQPRGSSCNFWSTFKVIQYVSV